MQHRLAAMRVVQLADAAEFLERAAPLLADEARHNLILGLAGTLRTIPTSTPSTSSGSSRTGDAVVGAALRTPPYNLVLGVRRATRRWPRSPPSVGGELPGAVGAVPEVDASSPPTRACTASRRSRGCGRGSTRSTRRAARRAAGARAPRRRPTATLLVRWWGEFGVEALGAIEQDEEQNGRNVDHRLTTPGNGIALWEDDGEPVSRRRLRQPDADRGPDRPGLHAARAPRPRLRERAHRARLGGAARRRPQLLLPLHRPREPDLEQDLRRDRLPPRLRLDPVRLRLERDVAVLALRR